MAISKLVLNGATQMDLTQDTVDASDLLYGETAHGADGEAVTGTIASKSSSDLTVSGATVTAPAGYYAQSASKSVASGSVRAPDIIATTTPTISVNSSTGLITASTSWSTTVTPTVTPGYVTSGIDGTVSVSGTKTTQISSPDLIGSNIKSGVTLFGVQGTAASTVSGEVLTVAFGTTSGEVLNLNG